MEEMISNPDGNAEFKKALRSAFGIDVFLTTNTLIEDIPTALSGFDCRRVQVRNGGSTEIWGRSDGGWREKPRIGRFEDLCADHVEFVAYTVGFGGGGEPIDGGDLSLPQEEASAWLRHMERYKHELEDSISCSVLSNSGRSCALTCIPLGRFKMMVDPDAAWAPKVMSWVRRVRETGADEVCVLISHDKKQGE